MRFLGGANHAVKILGEKPGNWNVMQYDEVSAREFLEDLDFFVHYPHERYIEEFGRAIMEAMALGIPAILPPEFEETFGDAVTYATPANVPKTIIKLWNSNEAYLERAQAGRKFVIENCGISDFRGRLETLLQVTESTDNDNEVCAAADTEAAANQT